MRRLRLAAPVQLLMVLEEVDAVVEGVWPSLSERSRLEVLSLFARLIARGVVEVEEDQK